jgi:hypothetical protein
LNADDTGGSAGAGLILETIDLLAQSVDGSLDSSGVIWGDGNLLTLEFECAIYDSRLDFAVGSGGDGDDVCELKVGRAELGELANKAVSMGAADTGLLGTKLIPGEVEGLVGFRLAHMLKAGDTSGRTMMREHVESLLPAYPGSEGYCVDSFIHIDSKGKPLLMSGFLQPFC